MVGSLLAAIKLLVESVLSCNEFVVRIDFEKLGEAKRSLFIVIEYGLPLL